jgi:hypothetical protein
MTLETDEKRAAITRRTAALGSLASLMDVHLLDILSYLCVDLFSVTGTSKYLYSLTLGSDGLYRDACCEKYAGAMSAGTYRSNIGSGSGDPAWSWRDQFYFKICQDVGQTFEPHVVLSGLPPVYCDAIYRGFLCRAILPPPLPSTKTMPGSALVDEVEDCTYETFVKYEESNTPLLLKNITKGTSVLSWTVDRLAAVSASTEATTTFRTTSTQSRHAPNTTIASYASYCNGVFSESPFYLFDRSFMEKIEGCGFESWTSVLSEKAPWFRHHTSGKVAGFEDHKTDLLSTLGDDRPDFEWLIAGPAQSGSAFHIDPNGTHAWNMPITGRKLWLFYPPGVTPPGVVVENSGDDVRMPVTVGEWIACFWDAHRKNMMAGGRDGPMECLAAPGDILFVPHGWWHCVLNVDDEVSVALTSNYISTTNLSDCIRFFEMNKGQISGCGDRLGERFKDEIGGKFKDAMVAGKGGRLLKEIYEREKKRSEEGWKCRAWGGEKGLEELDIKNKNKRKGESVMGMAKKKGDGGVVRVEENYEKAVEEKGGFSFGFAM